MNKPNTEIMLAHLNHLFGEWSEENDDALIELAWSTAAGPDSAKLFWTTEIDALVEFAADINSKPGHNVYIGAALRKPETARNKRALDDDFLALTALYADCDDDGVLAAARDLCTKRGLPPTAIGVTGDLPHKRGQLWWKLKSPITDPNIHRQLIRNIAKTVGGDTVVINPSRIMRLCGSIAWPKKPGRVEGMTNFVCSKTHLDIALAHKAFPPQEQAETKQRLNPDAVLADINHDEKNWRKSMLSVSAHHVALGLSDEQILAKMTPFTLSGWTTEQTKKELLVMIAGAREKGFAPETNTEEWDELIRLREYDLPQFPTQTLPAWLKNLVEELAQSTQTPPDLAAMLAIGACAVACAKKTAIVVRQGWVEPLNLYTVVVLAPGNRKSRVFADIEGPITEYEADAVRKARPAIAAAETSRDILHGRLQNAKTKAAKGLGSEADMCATEAEDLAKQSADFKVPCPPRLIADDITVERLSTILCEQEGRMAVMSAEGGVFALMAGRYAKNGMPNFEVFLKGHSGDTVRVDRVNRPPEYVNTPAVTISLAIQPDVLEGLKGEPGFQGRGLLGRFLYSMPTSAVGKRTLNAPPLSEATRHIYGRNIQRLLSMPFKRDEYEQIQSHLIKLSDGARMVINGFEALIEPRLAEAADLGHMVDWGGKLVGAVARIAGILHMAQNAAHDAPWDLPVAPETAQDAVRIGLYLIEHAKAAYGNMGADKNTEDALKIAAWIKNEGVEVFKKRDAFNALQRVFGHVEAMNFALSKLQENGYIRLLKHQNRQKTGRPPSPAFEVNPEIMHLNRFSGSSVCSAYDSGTRPAVKEAKNGESSVCSADKPYNQTFLGNIYNNNIDFSLMAPSKPYAEHTKLGPADMFGPDPTAENDQKPSKLAVSENGPPGPNGAAKKSDQAVWEDI